MLLVRRISCLYLFSVSLIIGCNDDPLKKVHVHGTVTFDGGACPGTGRVTFSPIKIADGLVKRPASGKFGKDGKYEAMSFRPADGLVPGTYRASVACFDPSKLQGNPGDEEFRRASCVASSFEPQELVVEPGSGSMEFNIDVPLKK